MKKLTQFQNKLHYFERKKSIRFLILGARDISTPLVMWYETKAEQNTNIATNKHRTVWRWHFTRNILILFICSNSSMSSSFRVFTLFFQFFWLNRSSGETFVMQNLGISCSRFFLVKKPSQKTCENPIYVQVSKSGHWTGQISLFLIIMSAHTALSPEPTKTHIFSIL